MHTNHSNLRSLARRVSCFGAGAAAILSLTAACGGGTVTAPTGHSVNPQAELAAAGDTLVEAAEEQATALGVEAALRAALVLPIRTEEERARDQYRNPVETLTFFGIEPTMTVIELSPGAGWYTKVLAPVLMSHGQLIAATGDPDGDPEAYVTRLTQEYMAMITQASDVLGSIQTRVWGPDRWELGEPGSADMVVSFRSAHGWYNREVAPHVFGAVYDVLKPGGVFGVVQHRAADDADISETSSQGYVPTAWVIEQAEAAGFVLDASSEINANPLDTRNHPEGVWTLLPSLRLGDQDREHYMAIGESDRMTLRFVKPE